MLALLADVVADATSAFDAFDYARALERSERFFWQFCDDYVELVKGRAYGGAGDAVATSAQVALRLALSTLQRLFAPFLPFVTEEVWSWWHDDESIHRAPWPDAESLRAIGGDELVFSVASDVIGAVRKVKSEQRRSLATPVTRADVRDTEARLAALDAARSDVVEAGKIAQLETAAAGELAVAVELAPPES
jgi:valyl-tRNA synthetase